MREVFIANPPTFLDETRDPDSPQMDVDALAGFDKPALLTSGTESAPFFGPVVDMIASHMPRAERITIDGADHVAHISVPDRYIELITTFARTERAAENC
jgi:pimeloyl-ACP methyl ester carboxylesterase